MAEEYLIDVTTFVNCV